MGVIVKNNKREKPKLKDYIIAFVILIIASAIMAELAVIMVNFQPK